jgi:hypothetical protein
MTPFPRLRWVAAAWALVWIVAYARAYPASNFLNLCDLAALLTCIGLWRGQPLLLSTQAVSSLVITLLWVLDVGFRLGLGRHPIGGTEYMFNPQLPIGLRLLSLFHVALPIVLLLALRRVGYDRRALAFQSAFAAIVIPLSRLTDPATNVNFAFRDPFRHAAMGPAAVHVALTLAGLLLAVYLPTHLLLVRLFETPQSLAAAPRGTSSSARAPAS